MSAEKPSAPEQPTPSTPQTPEVVTRDNLTAENISSFTPQSYEDEQAAEAFEASSFKVIDKRKFDRAELGLPTSAFAETPAPSPEPTPDPDPAPKAPHGFDQKEYEADVEDKRVAFNERIEKKRRPLGRAALARLSLDELHDLIKPMIPEDEEYESGYDSKLSDDEVADFTDHSIRLLEEDLAYPGSLAEKYNRRKKKPEPKKKPAPKEQLKPQEKPQPETDAFRDELRDLGQKTKEALRADRPTPNLVAALHNKQEEKKSA